MRAIWIVTALFAACGLSFAQAGSPAELKRIEAEKMKYERLMIAFWKDGSNPQARRAFLDQAMVYATTVMNSPALEPKVKYPLALRVYRRVLFHEPSNETAKANARMIEDIYRSMGRPIPK